MTTVLVTGAGGQLGHDLVEAFSRGSAPCDVVGAGHDALDVTSRDLVHQAVASLRPTAIVHAAAWTAVDACELDPDKAFAVNALGTRNVAEAARRFGAHVCYVSTDYVFDGLSDRPYVEWDPPHPLSVYGRSKLGGESELGPGDTVVRTSWVCGAHGANMVRTVLGLWRKGVPLRFVDDQVASPTFTRGLASTIRELSLGHRPGVYHVTHQGTTSWYGFARAVVEAAGGNPDQVEAIATVDLDPPRPAPRPANSVLDNAALRLAGLPLLPDWHGPLEELVRELSA